MPAARAESPRVAFYTRISTDEDHQKYSPGAQKERLEAFSKAQWGDAWQLHKVYRDTESGTHMNRPGLEEILYDAGNQAFNTLLVFRVDRLSRKVRELAQMVDELTKNGVALKSITEPFDTSNAAGKMMLQMLGVFAEFEHATIVERTKVGMQKKAKGGNFVGGHVPYYVCSKRYNDHDCEQDYVRADLLESAIIEDIKAMFRDEQFMARVWAEANQRLCAEKPNLEKEIAKVAAEAAKAQTALDRYFEAFEAGTLNAELCNEKVRDLRARLEELEAEKRDLETRRERLELPAIDRDMLASLVDHFERVMAEAPNPQKKDLLRRLVKRVLVHDRHTIEVWYGLPNCRKVEGWNNWLLRQDSNLQPSG